MRFQQFERLDSIQHSQQVRVGIHDVGGEGAWRFERSRRLTESLSSMKCFLILTVILPRFTAIYADKGAMLPGPTRALLATSSMLVDHWPIWLGGTLGLILAVSLWLRTSM